MRLIELSLPILLLAAPAFAGEAEPPSVKDDAKLAKAEPLESEEESDLDKVRCKYAMVVDSRIPQRVCMTEFEWKQRRLDQMESKRSSRNRNSGCSEASGPC